MGAWGDFPWMVSCSGHRVSPEGATEPRQGMVRSEIPAVRVSQNPNPEGVTDQGHGANL